MAADGTKAGSKVKARAEKEQKRTERRQPPMRTGRLLVIGGAEDPDEDCMTILPKLVEMAGGKRARIIVCSSPSEDPQGKVDTYGALFKKIGVAEVIAAPITDRHQAEEPELLKAVERATAVFFTGGDQLRLTALIAGTEFCENIRSRLYGDGLHLRRAADAMRRYLDERVRA